MITSRNETIRLSARRLLGKVWARRDEFFDCATVEEHDTTLRLQVVRHAPEIIVREILGFRLEEPVENRSDIPNDRGVVVSDVAGMIDRTEGMVCVARNLPPEQRRFTLAHEIGHLVLHPKHINLHRDRPIGQHRPHSRRPWYEREADVFAAELLMPSRLLTEIFCGCFGGPIDGSRPDNSLAFKLSSATGRELRAIDFAQYSAIERALVIASVSEFGTNIFESLSRRFAVSRTAMAIQLVETGLVA
jgi:hypothetical protein